MKKRILLFVSIFLIIGIIDIVIRLIFFNLFGENIRINLINGIIQIVNKKNYVFGFYSLYDIDHNIIRFILQPFIFLSVLIPFILLIVKVEKLNKILLVGICLLLSGIFANTIDRMIFGYIHLPLSFIYIMKYSVFCLWNLADILIAISFVIIVIGYIKLSKELNFNKWYLKVLYIIGIYFIISPLCILPILLIIRIKKEK